jgi:hypothetical protein
MPSSIWTHTSLFFVICSFLIQLNDKLFYNILLLFATKRRLIDSLQMLNGTFNEKDDEFVRKKLTNFCCLLKDSKQGEEVNSSIINLIRIFILRIMMKL